MLKELSTILSKVPLLIFSLYLPPALSALGLAAILFSIISLVTEEFSPAYPTFLYLGLALIFSSIGIIALCQRILCGRKKDPKATVVGVSLFGKFTGALVEPFLEAFSSELKAEQQRFLESSRTSKIKLLK